MESNEKWYSVKEVAYKRGVSQDTVRRWIKRKLLRAFKLPSGSSRRKRIYECFRIAEGELDHFTKRHFTS